CQSLRSSARAANEASTHQATTPGIRRGKRRVALFVGVIAWFGVQALREELFSNVAPFVHQTRKRRSASGKTQHWKATLWKVAPPPERGRPQPQRAQHRQRV